MEQGQLQVKTQEYDFVVEHVAGKDNGLAHLLSRPQRTEDSTTEQHQTEICAHILEGLPEVFQTQDAAGQLYDIHKIRILQSTQMMEAYKKEKT